jgi:hypothetical protein
MDRSLISFQPNNRTMKSWNDAQMTSIREGFCRQTPRSGTGAKDSSRTSQVFYTLVFQGHSPRRVVFCGNPINPSIFIPPLTRRTSENN